MCSRAATSHLESIGRGDTVHRGRGKMRSALYAATAATFALTIFACAPMYQDRAQNEVATGQYDAAVADITAAVDHDPNNLKLKNLAAQIFTQRGAQYYQGGQMLAASDDFHRAISYDPMYSRAYDYLGMLSFQQHNWQDAINYGDKAASLEGKPDPDYVKAAQQQLQNVRWGFKPYRVRP
jgi:tetratricopeptide (TPR) repeat protein